MQSLLFNESHDAETTTKLLKQAASASVEEVATVAQAVVPALGPAIARAWQWLNRFPLAIQDWSIGEPPIAVSRPIWLRDLLRELMRHDLPAKPEDALRWLAVYVGEHAPQADGEMAALISKLLGGSFFPSGTTGCDHVGRLLACEIAHDTPIAEDLIDTLKLVGMGRHPALSPNKRLIPTTHVARGLAACGREDAVEILCETITVDRGDPQLTVTAALQATSAAIEVASITPGVLASVLETMAGAIGDGKLNREALAAPLSALLSLPTPFLADESCGDSLQRCAQALRDSDTRELMISSDDETEVYFGFWALSALDINDCGERLRQRYDQACDDGNEEVKTTVRTFARLRNTRTLAMRPIWLRMLAEVAGENRDPLNLQLVAEVLNFSTAAGVKTSNEIVVPDDAALSLLVELEKRLRDPALKEQLAKISGAPSAYKIDSTLASMIVANLAGRSADVLLPLVSVLDFDGFSLLVDADFTKADAATRAAVFGRATTSFPNGARIMVHAVAAAESPQELTQWSLSRFEKHPVDPLFAVSCALRSDRVEFWRTFLSAGKKPMRELGLKLLIATLMVLDQTQRFEESKILSSISADGKVDVGAIRFDASQVLEEYQATQGSKKKGDDLKSYYVRTACELARTEDAIEQVAAKRRQALLRLSEQVAQMTGIATHRFIATAPSGPRDCGTTYADLLGQAAPKILQAAEKFIVDVRSQSLTPEDQYHLLNQWFAQRPAELRESDGSEVSRLTNWFWHADSWSTFEEKVLRRAQPLMQPDQLKRMSELSPPAIETSTKSLLRDWVRTLGNDGIDDFEAELLLRMDWYESILANLPESIQQLGPMAQPTPAPHPPHNSIVAYTYKNVCDYLRFTSAKPESKSNIQQRLWPLLWWTSSFGGHVENIDASAIAHAVTHGRATLYELVWFLVQPDHREVAHNLISAVEQPERMCLGIDANKDAEIKSVVAAVADICRSQEHAADPSLPATLTNTWRSLPSPPSRAMLFEVLEKYAQTTFQVVGSTNDQQKMFVARLDEALNRESDIWLLPDASPKVQSERTIDFDKIDAWRKSTEQGLRELLTRKVISEEQLLRIALHRPLLLRSVLEITGRRDLLEAAIWLIVHLDQGISELAMTLDAGTGHAHVRRSIANGSQLRYRLVAHYVPNFPTQLVPFTPWIEHLTIRRSWKEAAIDAQPRHELKPLFDALRAVMTAADRQRIEGWLDAMDGKLSSPTQRQKLEDSIKDRPNAALLQLALLPLPSDREPMIADISRRLKILEVITIAGRKGKSVAARENVQRAVDRVRNTLADNAGLADPVQLDWLSGEAIAKELAEFKRIEIDDYVIALQLRGDGPQLLVTKGGKAMKTLPAAVKSSDQGKRLLELQNRLKTSIRDARAVLERAMIEQQSFAADELKKIMSHPVVAAIARDLLFVMSVQPSSDQQVVGRPSADGEYLLGHDDTSTQVTKPVRIAHPLDLDAQGILGLWQNWFTDQTPQPFQQVERTLTRLQDCAINDDGTSMNPHNKVTIHNAEQAYRVLQAHGWYSDRDAGDFCRTFRGGQQGDVTATLTEFLWESGNIGPLEFRDANWKILPIADVPPIVLSETIRDIDRTIEATRIQ